MAPASSQPAPSPWTVAVYIDADNNLDENAMADLDEMMAAGKLNNVRVVYQLDRDNSLKGVDSGVERGIIENGKRRVIQRLKELNSDDPANISDFITWAFQSYPSKQRGLVMWDHGGQWDGGFGGDEHGPNTKDSSLTPEDFAKALQKSLTTLKVKQLDFLGFDTCLMGGAELLSQFAPLTKVYIASAEIDYGDGWNYAPTLKYLEQNPNATVKQFATAEVKFWEAQHRAELDDKLYGVHAAYDMSLWPAAQQKLNVFSGELIKAFANKKDAAALWEARGEAIQYSYSSQGDPPGITRPYVDLGQYASKVGQYSKSTDLKKQPRTLMPHLASWFLPAHLAHLEKPLLGCLFITLLTKKPYQMPLYSNAIPI